MYCLRSVVPLDLANESMGFQRQPAGCVSGSSFSIFSRDAPEIPPNDRIDNIIVTLCGVALFLIIIIAIAFTGYPSSTAMWDPEGLSRGYSCFPYDDDDEAGNLDKLEAAAPETDYKQLVQNQDLATSEGHLSWPDSFFECVVCLEQFEDDERVRWLRCGHIFHADCINTWYLRKHHTCPVCMSEYV